MSNALERRQWRNQQQVLAAIERANILLECPHKRVVTVIRVDEEFEGLIIDGEMETRCTKCGRVVKGAA